MKRFLLYLLIIFLIFSFHIISYSKSIQNNISENVIRLHVVANSDSDEDQQIKYLVRDNVIKYMDKIFSNAESIDAAKIKAKDNIDGIKYVVAETLRDSGYSYNFTVSFDTFCFPAKNYGDITLPSGKYEAIKIVLGSGKGKNWWCVMFPPLCFTDISTGIVPSSSKLQLKNTLSDDSFQLICSDPDVEFRFKVVDFVNSIL